MMALAQRASGLWLALLLLVGALMVSVVHGQGTCADIGELCGISTEDDLDCCGFTVFCESGCVANCETPPGGIAQPPEPGELCVEVEGGCLNEGGDCGRPSDCCDDLGCNIFEDGKCAQPEDICLQTGAPCDPSIVGDRVCCEGTCEARDASGRECLPSTDGIPPTSPTPPPELPSPPRPTPSDGSRPTVGYLCSTFQQEYEVRLGGGTFILSKKTDNGEDCASRCYQHLLEFGDFGGCRAAEYNTDTNKCELRVGVTIGNIVEVSPADDGTPSPRTVVACENGLFLTGSGCGTVDNCLGLYEGCILEETCEGTCSTTCCNGGEDPC